MPGGTRQGPPLLAGWAWEAAMRMSPTLLAMEMIDAARVAKRPPFSETLWRWGWPHSAHQLTNALDYLETAGLIFWGRENGGASVHGWVISIPGEAWLRDQRTMRCSDVGDGIREWLVVSAKGRWS